MLRRAGPRAGVVQGVAAVVTAMVLVLFALLGVPIWQMACLGLVAGCWAMAPSFATSSLPEGVDSLVLDAVAVNDALPDDPASESNELPGQVSDDACGLTSDADTVSEPENDCSASVETDRASDDTDDFTDQTRTAGCDPEMSQVFEDLLEVVRDVMSEVEDSTTNARELVREAVGNLGGSFESLKADAGTQRDLVLGMVSLMAEQSVSDVNGKMGSLRSFITESSSALHEFVDHIVNVSRESMSMVTKVDDLTKQMDEIQGVTLQARGLAAQTGLLALNAKIEAVHAGEHGRGFSVVADEVKALARESNEFNEQICEMVEATQVTIEATRKAIELIASKDMGAAIQSKGKVDRLANAVEEMNEGMAVTVGDISSTAHRLNENVGIAVRCLQFEDIVTQVLGYNESMIRHLFGFIDEFNQSLAALDPSSSDQLTQLVGSIAEFREGWRDAIHKPASQQDMEEGEVELF